MRPLKSLLLYARLQAAVVGGFYLTDLSCFLHHRGVSVFQSGPCCSLASNDLIPLCHLLSFVLQCFQSIECGNCEILRVINKHVRFIAKNEIGTIEMKYGPSST